MNIKSIGTIKRRIYFKKWDIFTNFYKKKKWKMG